MSKSQERGDDHDQAFKRLGDPYREHVLDVRHNLRKYVNPDPGQYQDSRRSRAGMAETKGFPSFQSPNRNVLSGV